MINGTRRSWSIFGEKHSIFIDRSVDTGDIADDLSDQRIREIIRDERLRDSTVPIVLVGTETRRRKHVDWEIYSSMFNGRINKKSGILVIILPTIDTTSVHAPHGKDEKKLYPDISLWRSIGSRAEYERLYPHMPDRIIDNLINSQATISVIPWKRITAESLTFLVESAFQGRASCNYDLSRPMRRVNS